MLDSVKALLLPTPAGAHTDHTRARTPHTVTPAEKIAASVDYDDAGMPQSITASLPDGLPEDAALAETLAVLQVMVPAGYRARLAEMKLDNAAWTRDRAYSAATEDGEPTKAPAVTRPIRRYRWVIEPVPAGEATTAADIEALIGVVRGVTLPRPVTVTTGRSLVVALADWQVGQADGSGVDGVVGRLAMIPMAIRAEVARLNRAGTPVEDIVLAGLGDLVEGCTSDWYSNQAFTVQLDRREQGKIVRRMLLEIVVQAVALGLPVTVAAVGGNHGENRGKGKVVTTYADNDDISVVEQVSDAIHLAAEQANDPALQAVKWAIPDGDRLSITLEVQGHVLALTHGHLARGGGSGAAAKIATWWKSQALAREPIGDADILLTGHYHHLIAHDVAGRMWLQAPALCDRSAWFAQSFGMVSRPGLLTFTIGQGGEQVDNVHVTDLDALAIAAAEGVAA